MSEKVLEKKLQIYRIRVNSLLEEHADVLAQAQDFHEQLKEAQQKIVKLEELLKEKDVQKKNPRVTIIDQPVEATDKQGKIS